MIGAPLVELAVPREVASPPTNSTFTDGLTGWLPYSNSGAWVVGSDGKVHPTTPTVSFPSVGLVVAASGAAPAPAKSAEGYVRVRGYTPVAGTIYPGRVTYPGGGVATGATAAVGVGNFDVNLRINTGTSGSNGAAFYFRPTVSNPFPNLSTFTVAELRYTWTEPNTDITCLCDTVSVQHGRDDPTGQPDASAATLNLSYDSVDEPSATAILAAAEIGAELHVSVVLNGTTYRRFTGYMTDLAYGWDDADELTPQRVNAQLVAVSVLSVLGRTVIGDTPWPQEIDGTRAGHIFQKAVQQLGGSVFDLAYQTDPGTVMVLALDVDSRPALEVLHELAESAEAIVWQQVGGTVGYADARHRTRNDPDLTLDACQLLVTPQWKRDLDGLINSVSVGFGEVPEGGEQARMAAKDWTSITLYGLYEYSVGTQLAAYADANTLAQDSLARRAYPSWDMATLPVDVAGLDAADTATLLALDMHALLELTGLPVAGGAPTGARLWVEGWREQLDPGAHTLELAVSSYARSAGAATWDTWGTDTWDQTDPALTWDKTRNAPAA